jgi:hypothetical protein
MGHTVCLLDALRPAAQVRDSQASVGRGALLCVCRGLRCPASSVTVRLGPGLDWWFGLDRSVARCVPGKKASR